MQMRLTCTGGATITRFQAEQGKFVEAEVRRSEEGIWYGTRASRQEKAGGTDQNKQTSIKGADADSAGRADYCFTRWHVHSNFLRILN